MSIQAIAMVCLACVFVSCEDEGDDKGNGGGQGLDSLGLSFGTVALVSTDLINAGLVEIDPPADCNFQLDIESGSGTCLTPSSFTGFATLLGASDSTVQDPDAGGARIAGVASNLDGAPDEVVNGGEFDMAVQSSFSTWNELWANYEYKSTYDYIGAELFYQRMTVELNSKFYTVLIPAYDQPFIDSDAASCVPEAERGAARYQNADKIPGLTFQRGDYLFCVKDSDDECEASDYRWYDKDSQSLVDTRPSNPRTHPWLVKDPITCNTEGEGQNFSIIGVPFSARLKSGFKLYADWSNGVNSVQWKDEKGAFGQEPNPDNLADEDYERPFLLYYYEDANGNQSEGTNLDMVFDFDVSESMFLEGVAQSDVASLTDAEIAAVIYSKHDWALEQKAEKNIVGYSPNHISGMEVSVEVTLSGGTEAPELPEE